MIKRTKMVTNLTVTLTEGEAADRARRAVEQVQKLTKLETESAEQRKSINLDLKELRKTVKELAKAAHTRKENSDVEAEQVFDSSTERTWIEYRGERFFERPMTTKEIQETVNRDVFENATKLKKTSEKSEQRVDVYKVNPDSAQTLEDIEGGMAAVGGL